MKRWKLLIIGLCLLVPLWVYAGTTHFDGNPTSVDATDIGDGSVTNTEFQYINTLSGNVEDALNARCLESVFGISLVADDLELSGTTLQLAAEIPHVDVAEDWTAKQDFQRAFTTLTGPAIWNCWAKTGEATGALDAIPIADLTNGDIAIVLDSSYDLYIYRFHSTATDVESDPDYIRAKNYSSEGVWYLTSSTANRKADDPYISLREKDGTSWYWGIDDAGNSVEWRTNSAVGNSVMMELDETTGNFRVAGSIKGKVAVGSDITANIALNTTDLHGTFYTITAACTVTLDKVSDVGFGAVVTFYVRDAAETAILEIDDADKINLNGTALAAGNVIDSAGGAGDFITLIAVTDADGSGTDGWRTLGRSGVWTDGGAS